jgi:hypothetical protein
MEPKKMNELFTVAKPALLALPSDSLVRPRIPRERATHLTTLLRREFQPLLPLLAAELAPARVALRHADFEALEANALIFYAADLAIEIPWTSEQKARRAYLVKSVHEHDDTLASWALPLFKRNKDLRPVVDDILRGRGTRDDADDTIRWVGLFRQEWSHVEGQTPVTLDSLSKAEEEATELLGILDAAEEETYGSPRDLRRRAFTRWIGTYSEIFHLGRYLLRGDPEAARRFLAISTERSEAAAAPEEAPAAAPTATTATTAVAAEAPAVAEAVGKPGGSK